MQTQTQAPQPTAHMVYVNLVCDPTWFPDVSETQGAISVIFYFNNSSCNNNVYSIKLWHQRLDILPFLLQRV